MSPSEGQIARSQAIAQVVNAVREAKSAGKEVDFDAVLQTHKNLLPELKDELNKLPREPRTAASAAGNTPTFTGEFEKPPLQISGYSIIRELSHGGQAYVYLALQLSTGRKIAIKVLRDGQFAGDKTIARFKREVQILAALNHPNIVSIIDTGKTAEGAHYITMPYIAGLTLGEFMKDRWKTDSADPGRLLRIFLKICRAVDAAHSRGIVHRDLKPSNVRIDTRGEPCVLDFGLARTSYDQGDLPNNNLSVTGQFLGSLPWASPEQASGDPDKIDIRTDVYSLGVILYQMLTCGRFPYEVAGNMRDVLNNIVTCDPIPPSKVVNARASRKTLADRAPHPTLPAVNEGIEKIVLKTLAKNPEERHQSAGLLAKEIAQYLDGQRTAGPAPAPSTGYFRKLFVVAGSLVFLAGLTTALIYTLTTKNPQSPTTDAPPISKTSSTLPTTIAAIPRPAPASRPPATTSPRMISREPRIPTTMVVNLAAATSQPQIPTASTAAISSSASQAAPPYTAAIPSPTSQPQTAATEPTAPFQPSDLPAIQIYGTCHLEGNDLVLTHPQHTQLGHLLFGDPNWTDYDLNLNVTINHNSSFLDDNASNTTFGIIFRSAIMGKKELHLECGMWGNRSIKFVANSPEGGLHNIRLRMGRIEPDHLYNICIQIRGSDYRCMVDNKEWFHETVEGFPKGCVGLISANPSIRFRDIKVTAPDGKILWSGPLDISTLRPFQKDPPGKVPIPPLRRSDLLALVDPPKNICSGNWVRKDNTLVCTSKDGGQIQFPFKPPADHYDFRITFVRNQGQGSITAIASQNGHLFNCGINGQIPTTTGLAPLFTGASDKLKRNIEPKIITGDQHSFVVAVRKDMVLTYFDGWQVGKQDNIDFLNTQLSTGIKAARGTLGIWISSPYTIVSADILEVDETNTALPAPVP